MMMMPEAESLKIACPPPLAPFFCDPYNPCNRMITDDEVVRLLREYGIQENFRVSNFSLFRRAFVHRSYVKQPAHENARSGVQVAARPANALPLYRKSNERLEFLGDGLLEMITKFYLYRRFPQENEGFMTEKKIALVKNEAIGQIALEMGLHTWFIISKHAEQKQTRTNLKKLGCLFEAFLGALFLECNKVQVRDDDALFRDVFVAGPGFQMVQIFVENIFEKHVNWMSLIHDDDNYKNILQVVIQKEFKVTPEYCELAAGGGGEGGEFHMGVYLLVGCSSADLQSQVRDHDTRAHSTFDDFRSFAAVHEAIAASKAVPPRIVLFLGDGRHKNKKKAEQLACKDALRTIGLDN